jgi:hypothetical protein
LGKSIATVKRMEGSELHPVQDDDGVWLFDEHEVRNVARERGRNGRAAVRLSAYGVNGDWFANVVRQREQEAREAEERKHVEEQQIRERLEVLERQALEQREPEAQRAREAERQEQLAQQ